MSIISMVYADENGNFPVGSYCDLDWTKQAKNFIVVMLETHEGFVVSEYEVNGYQDSDFYATVWNPETKIATDVLYASTRGWTYPNYAKVDASPEIMAQYQKWVAYEGRKARVQRNLSYRSRYMKIARECNIDHYLKVAHMAKHLSHNQFDAVVALLKTKKFRSTYRQSLNEQVRSWLATKVKPYSIPLSMRQLESITQFGY